MFEFTFEMEDVSNDITVEGFEGGIENITKFLENVRKESWFKEGNLTEGVVTFFGGDSVNLSWKTIDMVFEGGDISQKETDYEVEVGVNHPSWSGVFGETEIV